MYEKPLTKKSTTADFSVPYAIKLFFLIILLTFLLNGCSSVGQQSPSERISAELRQQQLQALTHFSLQASLGIKTPDDSVSGSLRWQQQDSAYQAKLNNVLGISLFELTQNDNNSSILIQGERYQADNAGSLLLQLTGWTMPLDDMPLWLKGLPGKNSRNLLLDEQGRVTAFSLTDSDGTEWQLQYQSFFNDSLSLPRRLTIHSDDIQIKLVIRSWQQ